MVATLLRMSPRLHYQVGYTSGSLERFSSEQTLIAHSNVRIISIDLCQAT